MAKHIVIVIETPDFPDYDQMLRDTARLLADLNAGHVPDSPAGANKGTTELLNGDEVSVDSARS